MPSFSKTPSDFILPTAVLEQYAPWWSETNTGSTLASLTFVLPVYLGASNSCTSEELVWATLVVS